MKNRKFKRIASLLLTFALIMSVSIQISFAEGELTDPISLKNCTITIDPSSCYYDKDNLQEFKPEVTVSYGDTTFVENDDYTVDYDENIEPGKGQVLIEATDKGTLTSWKLKTFDIFDKDIAVHNIKLSATSYTFKYILKDYETVKAVQKPTVTVTRTDGKKLVAGTDYTVTYSNNNSKDAGKYNVTVTGKGNYAGKIVKNYTIKPMTINGTDFYVGASRDYAYTGKSIKPAAIVNISKAAGNDWLWKALKKGTDYTVVSGPTYKNNKNIGYADIKIKIKGKGNFTGTRTLNGGFVIGPKQTKITSIKAGKRSIALKWKKVSNATGYMINYYGFKGEKDTPYKTVYVKKNSTVSKTIKNLKSGYTYYVDVQTYKSVRGDKISAWKDNSKSVKVK